MPTASTTPAQQKRLSASSAEPVQVRLRVNKRGDWAARAGRGRRSRTATRRRPGYLHCVRSAAAKWLRTGTERLVELLSGGRVRTFLVSEEVAAK